MSGRVIGGVGTKINVAAVTGITSANANPAVSQNQEQEVTVAGTPSAITSETLVGVVGGAPGTGDTLRTTLDGVDYDFVCTPTTTIAQAAAGVTAACMVGVKDSWSFLIAGAGGAGGDTETLTLDGTPYDYVTAPADTAAMVASGLAALAVADPTYDVSNVGDKVIVTAKNVGPALTVTMATDGVQFTDTPTHTATGRNPQTAWTVSDDGIDTVTIEYATPGDPGAATASGTVILGAGSTTYSPAQTIVGAAADDAILFDGISASWQHTVTAGQSTADIATALAALINGSGGYTASALASVITITRTDFAAFAFVDQSVLNPASSLTLTPATTVPLIAPLALTAGVDISGSRSDTGHLLCSLNAGTSYDTESWLLINGVWTQDLSWGTAGVDTIAGTGLLPCAIAGTRLYVYCSNFVGGADATITVLTSM